MRLRIALVILALGFAVPASAQNGGIGVAASFAQLQVLVAPGNTVTVTDPSGSVTRGRIESLSTAAMELLVDGSRRTYGETDISTVTQRRGDSLANGAWWGFGVGAALVALAVVSCDGCGVESAHDYALVAVASAAYGGMGAAIGVGIDAMIRGQQTVFRRPGAVVSFRF